MEQFMPKNKRKLCSITHPHRLEHDPTNHNIFNIQECNPELKLPTAMHLIVGDYDFKLQMIAKNKAKMQSTHNNKDINQQENHKIDNQVSNISKSKWFDIGSNSQRTLFCLDQVDNNIRERRTLRNFHQTQQKWKQTESSLINRTNRDKSLSFAAVKNLYLHPNANKMELLNDDIPLYWQHSLRDNNKRLKNYLKNQPYKKEIADQMLQTLAGRRQLEASIPTIQQRCQTLKLKGKYLKQIDNKFSKTIDIPDQTYKMQYQRKKKWLNQVNITQTMFPSLTTF